MKRISTIIAMLLVTFMAMACGGETAEPTVAPTALPPTSFPTATTGPTATPLPTRESTETPVVEAQIGDSDRLQFVTVYADW